MVLTQVWFQTKCKWDDSYKVKGPIYDKWQALVEKYLARAPLGMKTMFQASEDFPDMTAEIALHQTVMKLILVSNAANFLLQPILT